MHDTNQQIHSLLDELVGEVVVWIVQGRMTRTCSEAEEATREPAREVAEIL